MQTSPNQKVVTVRKEAVKKETGKARPYFTQYIDTLQVAMKDLTTVGSLKAYMYLVANQDGYTFALSTKDIADKTGLSLTTAKTAINELIKKGYLTKNNGNQYIFNELPVKQPVDLPVTVSKALQKKQFRNSETGEILSMTFDELLKQCGDREIAEQCWNAA